MAQRPGLQLWGPVGRWAFLNWPRGSWQYDLICAAVIAGLFVLPGPEQGAEGWLDLEAVLSAIEASDQDLDSFTAEMVVTEHYVLFDDVSIERGRLAFLKPSYVRREIEEPALRTEVLAEGLAQVYIPRVKQVEQYPLESSQQREQLVVPGLASASDLRAAYDVELVEVTEADGSVGEAGTERAFPSEPAVETAQGNDGRRTYVLRLVPKPGTEAEKHWRAIKLWVSEGQWHPARRILLQQHSGDTHTIEFWDVVRNPDLGPDDFKLRLPSDVKVIKHSLPSAK